MAGFEPGQPGSWSFTDDAVSFVPPTGEHLRILVRYRTHDDRVVTEPIEFHGQTLRRGQRVLFLFASANRDEREFPDPDRYDIRRRPPRILSFGHGVHRCLGANFAKMEGRVMLEELLAVAPNYELDLPRASRFRSEFFAGFASLPIRFDPVTR